MGPEKKRLDPVTDPNRDMSGWLATVKSLPGNGAKLPRYGREGAVDVRPFPAEKTHLASEVERLSGEAVKENPDDDGNPPSR